MITRERRMFRIGGHASCLVVMTLLLAACVSQRDWMDYDESAMFSGYRTFAWMPREHHASRNPLVVQRAHDAIQAVLTRKGYTETANITEADFIIDFTIGTRDRIDLQSYPRPYFVPDLTVYSEWWGNPYWGPQIDAHQYREGTLAVDVFDPVSRMPVWHGGAGRELTRSEQERSGASIRAVVEAALRSFPPR